MPASALATIPSGQPQHGVLQDPQPPKVTRHTWSTEGTTIYKTIPSNLGEAVLPPNSYSQSQKVKQFEKTEEYTPNEE